MTSKSPRKNRVLVAMSGGVDSSVALLKMVEASYDAIGITMKLWESRNPYGILLNESYCCSLDAIHNAKFVCSMLEVPHYTVDFQNLFRQKVVDYFGEEYLSGRTPNPCIRCNSEVRWHALMALADEMDIEWIATGHYACIERTDPDNPVIKKAHDLSKDQSYVLWNLNKKALKRTLFPLGEMKKAEVRALAKKANLPTADIPDSQEICFVPDNDYRKFLKEYKSDGVAQNSSGKFLDTWGNFLGEHKGIYQYTIGQRRGLGVSGPEALYVRQINQADGTITLAPNRYMFFEGCNVGDLHWLKKPTSQNNIVVHLRYRHPGISCTISEIANSTLQVKFQTPQFAVTPGQSAVFYRDDILLGGGIIMEGYHHE